MWYGLNYEQHGHRLNNERNAGEAMEKPQMAYDILRKMQNQVEVAKTLDYIGRHCAH